MRGYVIKTDTHSLWKSRQHGIFFETKKEAKWVINDFGERTRRIKAIDTSKWYVVNATLSIPKTTKCKP